VAATSSYAARKTVGVVRRRGYRVASASAARAPASDEQVFIAIQIGNELPEEADSSAALPVACLLRVTGAGRHPRSQRWTVAKEFESAGPVHEAGLAFNADVIVTGDVSDQATGKRLQDCYACLKELIGDARRTLTDLARERARSGPRQVTCSTVHVELVCIGDLVAGRTGLLRAMRRQAVTESEIALRLRACDILEFAVLADVAAMLRTLSDPGASIVPSLPNEEAPVIGPARRTGLTPRSTDRCLTPQLNSSSYQDGD
jgi:hypothetical protein